jgi:hypothetical protein
MTFLFVFSISDSAPVKIPGLIFYLSAFVLLISGTHDHLFQLIR